MAEPPPPPYSLTADYKMPSITLSTDLPDEKLSASLFPPPPPPTQPAGRPRPVSWNPSQSLVQEQLYFPPPPGKASPSIDMRASVSGPLDDPFAPAQACNTKAPYVPPSPMSQQRRSSHVPPEKTVDRFDSSVQASIALYEPVEKPLLSFPGPPGALGQTPEPASYQHRFASPASLEKIPQYQQPFNALTQTHHPQPHPQNTGLDVRPSLPPRPVSSPGFAVSGPSSTPAQSPALPSSSMGAPLAHTASVGGLEQQMAAMHVADQVGFSGKEDQVKSSYGRRFVSNMTVARITRAGWQSTMSTVSLPFHLSPWGDNNPITLPNIRKRDVALTGIAFVGASMMLPSDLTVIEEGAKWAGKFVAEQAVDETIHHMEKEKVFAFTARAGVSSTAVKISHKMIGEHAELRLEGSRQAEDYTDCAKGWFCPYLYASGRAPRLERNKDFEICSFFGPGLAADTKVAPVLLRCTMQARQSNVIPYCPWETPTPARAHFSRIAVFFLGIAPYRSQAWSQARIPNEARLQFHLLSGIPVMVLPVTAATPICAWSGHTVKQLWDGAFNVDAHIDFVLSFLQSFLDVPGLDKQWQEDWRTSVRLTLKQMFDGAMLLRGGYHILAKEVDPERTGLVIYRY